MAVSYKKLWKLLIDKDMKKMDLAKEAKISGNTITKMSKGENVTTDILVKICSTLKCNIEDIMEIVETDQETDKQMSVIWYIEDDIIILCNYKPKEEL